MILTTGGWSHAERLLFAVGGFSICFVIFVAFIVLNISEYLNNEQQRKNDLYYECMKGKRRKRRNRNEK